MAGASISLMTPAFSTTPVYKRLKYRALSSRLYVSIATVRRADGSFYLYELPEESFVAMLVLPFFRTVIARLTKSPDLSLTAKSTFLTTVFARFSRSSLSHSFFSSSSELSNMLSSVSSLSSCSTPSSFSYSFLRADNRRVLASSSVCEGANGKRSKFCARLVPDS
jgi:hypothetical protein